MGLLLYYDAVLTVSLKRPVMIAVKFYCSHEYRRWGGWTFMWRG